MHASRTISWFVLPLAAACGGGDTAFNPAPAPAPAPTPTPTVVAPGPIVAALAGADHTCGFAAHSGGLYCWGGNGSGQLGNGTTENSVKPVAVTALGFEVVTVGARFTCGWIDGALYCWGDNAHGQLGDGTYTSSPVPVKVKSPVRLPGSPEFLVSDFRAGGSHACMTNGNDAFCWGSNSFGELGVAAPDTSALALRLPRPPDADPYSFWNSVATGKSHSCAVLEDLNAWCWGNNSRGQLGNGTYSAHAEPRIIAGTKLLYVVAGGSHTCGLVGSSTYTPNMRAVCWGANSSGQLGDATTGDSALPVPVATQRTFSGISAGGSHTCALAPEGALYCWGSNTHGQLGNGTTVDSAVPVPVLVAGVAGGAAGFTSISAGEEHTCATSAGRAYCWGSNTSGQLGNGTTIDSSVPVPIGSPT